MLSAVRVASVRYKALITMLKEFHNKS